MKESTKTKLITSLLNYALIISISIFIYSGNLKFRSFVLENVDLFFYPSLVFMLILSFYLGFDPLKKKIKDKV